MVEELERRPESSAAPPTPGSDDETLMPMRYWLRLARPTEEQKVVSFVDKAEKAHLYFDFRVFFEETKPWNTGVPYGSIHTEIPKLTNKFDALSRTDISGAMEAYLSRRRRPIISKGEDTKRLLLKQLEEEDLYAFSSPTFRAVFLSRNGVYDMDLCPKKELKKKNDSLDYSRVYDMDLCPKKELKKKNDSLDYSREHFIYNEPAAMWRENNEKCAAKYEEACIKYKKLLSRKTENVKVDGEAENPLVVAIDEVPKEVEMTVKRLKRKSLKGKHLRRYVPKEVEMPLKRLKRKLMRRYIPKEVEMLRKRLKRKLMRL